LYFQENSGPGQNSAEDINPGIGRTGYVNCTAQRTRLNALFSTEGIQTKLVLQDVRYWGSQPQLVANEDYATSVHEAWAEVNAFSNFSLRAGRQELVYDDHRILEM
jgi:hypothetical protein